MLDLNQTHRHPPLKPQPSRLDRAPLENRDPDKNGAAIPAPVEPPAVFRAALRTHIPALDGLRGVAILAVLCFHLTDVMIASPSSPWIDRVLRRVFSQGWMGVDLFFVLSGFLITGILLDAKGTAHYFRNFYARRVLRIFPLYYAVVAFYLLVLPRIAPQASSVYGVVIGHPLLYWLYLSNHAIAHALAGGRQSFVGVLGPTWSLGVEEQFYLFWPLVVYLSSRRGMIRACIGAVALAIALRIVLLANGTHWAYISTLTPCRLDALAIGGLLACLIRQRPGLARLARRAVPVAALSALAFALIFATQHLISWDQGRMRYAFGFTVVAVLSACLMLLAITGPRRRLLSRLLTHPLLTTFGKYSYGLYLLHVPLQEVIRRHMIPVERFPTLAGSHLPGTLAYMGVSLSIYYVAAWLSWHLFEVQFLKLKRLVPMGRRSRVPHPPGSF